MSTEQRRREIAAAFQRSLKQDNTEEIEQFGISELRDADAMLGDRDLNAGYRIALRNRISHLETEENRRAANEYRALNYLMGVATVLLVAALAAWLFR